MAGRTHYEVLGVAPDAPGTAIRDAYRRRAREHHPDRARTSAVGSSVAMPEVNEAYRVLRDPARRALYDASLRGGGPAPAGSSGRAAPGEHEVTQETWPGAAAQRLQPARVPWRGLLVCGVLASVGIVALAQFTDPPKDPGPDGILRAGNCVAIEPNNDAREVSCTGDVETDLVVVDLVPFDRACPGGTVSHRDRQGMGNACVDSRRPPQQP